MQNPITNLPGHLIPHLGSALAGINKYGVALGLPAGLGATFTAHDTELTALHNAYQTAKTGAKNATAAKNVALKEARIFVMKVRKLNKPTVGYKYSQFWDAFGLTGNLRVPDKVEPMLVTLPTLGSHLTDNPQFGSEDAGLTGAQAGVQETTLSNTRTAAAEAKSALQQANNARMAKAKVVQLALRELFSILLFKLEPLDPRWLEFGFNKPGALPIPDKPVDFTIVLIGGNNILVKWPASARAEFYRIWMRVVEPGTVLAPMGTSADLSFLLENVPTNAQVEVALSAINNGGESARSAVQMLVIP